MPTLIDTTPKSPDHDAPTNAAGPFTGWHFLGLMVMFFGTVIAVNIYMATKATGTWTGMMVKNSYVASQQFNEKLDQLGAQNDLGWSGALGYREESVVLTVKDHQEMGIVLDEASVKIGRPAYEQDDQVLDLIPRSAGHYEAKIKLAPGPWLLAVAGQKNGEAYRLETRIFIAKDGTEVR